MLKALDEPDQPATGGMVTTMSSHQRLSLAMRLANPSDPSDIPGPSAYSNATLNGVPNPYGRGIKAYEPDTIIGSAYGQAKQAQDLAKADAEAKKATTITVQAPLADATGKVGAAVQAALNLAARHVPYVWGGTSANGVDCSGMLYFAFRSAGIDTKRYRAVDYGHMGTEVTVDQAQPGDVIYYDEPGDTDHVGLYIGNGKMVQAPQTGDVVKVSSIGHPTSIRRIFSDDAFGKMATPSGGTATSYGGMPYAPVLPGGGATSTIYRRGTAHPAL